MALSAMFILEVVIVFSFVVTSLFMFIPKNLASVKYANANGCLLALPCACRNRNYNFGCQGQAQCARKALLNAYNNTFRFGILFFRLIFLIFRHKKTRTDDVGG